MRIAIYAFDDMTMFHLSIPQMVFDDVARLGIEDWETVLFSDQPGSIRTQEGHSISDIAGPEATASADIVVLPAWFSDGRPLSDHMRLALTEAHDRGATIAGLCLGAFAVADAGLLSNRSAATHWRSVGDLAALHPDITVDPRALYVDHGDVITSAGIASGIDACLHLVRRRLGADVANRIARDLVVAPHREGGQAQFIERPLASYVGDDAVSVTSSWALAHLDEDLSIERLASVAHMSRRTFVRAFRAATGATPAAWVRARRLDEARRLLETTDLSIDQVSALSGFGRPDTFRQNFVSAFGGTPSSYRRRFDART